MSDSIKVAIKVRPLIKRERDENLQIQWVTQGNSVVAVDAEIKKRGDGGFLFDHIFDTNANNSNVFDTIVKPIVDAAVNGFNGTVFAYGQTSSGKTYTMMGTHEESGIIPLAIEYMFDAIANTPGREFLLRVSYLEIYNERINDLLNNDNMDLKIHEDINGQVFVRCKEEVTNSPENVLSIMNKGNKNKRMGETNMNERSSRSHTIFKITIESREADADSDGAIQVSQLNMVDLAGSERARQTGATGERFKEGRHINLSLSTLALVIKQLSESQDSQKYINFRDSKLTRLLQASLGGNAMTAMICAITPAALDETQCTLSFASRARNIRNKPQLNEVMSDGVLLKRYAKQIDKLQAELDRLKQVNHSAEVQEMESKIQEKDRINEDLEERIKLLQTWIVPGDNRNNSESFKCKAKRRRTWCGTGANKLNTFTFQSRADLSPIKEMSPLKPCRKNIFQSTDIKNTSFQIAYTDFELELIKNQEDRETENDSDDDVFVTRRKHNRVTFTDNVTIHKSPITYETCSNSTEKINTFTQTASNQSPGTPKNTLRERIRHLTKEYTQLQEYTTLEKQLYIEDHHSEIKEKLATFSSLEKQLENLTFDKESFEHVASDLRKKLNTAEFRYTSAEEKLNMQKVELERIPDLEKKIEQMSAKEIELQSIPELQKQITLLTSEKDGYEHVASELRKKLNESVQRNILLEDKLAAQNIELEKQFTAMSLEKENAQHLEWETRITNLDTEKNELICKISDLQNQMTEKELDSNLLRDQLNEQKATLEIFQDQKKQIEQLISKKQEFEVMIGELQEKLVEAETTNKSIIDNMQEHQRDVKKYEQLDKQIQHLLNEKIESEQIINELKNKLKETEVMNNTLKNMLNTESCTQKSHNFEKEFENHAIEKYQLGCVALEMKETLKEPELVNNSLQISYNNKQEIGIIRTDQLDEILESKDDKLEHIVCELPEKLKEIGLHSTLMEERSSEQELQLQTNELKEKVVTIEQHPSVEDEIEDTQQTQSQKIEELEAQIAKLIFKNDEYERINAQLRRKSMKSFSEKEFVDDRNNDDEINHLKSRINDLQNIIKDVQRENDNLKELSSKSLMLDHDCDFSNHSFSKTIGELSSTRISLEDSMRLSTDLLLKNQELDDIKHDVQSLKEDIEKLQKTICLLTSENAELANKLSADKECTEELTTRFQETIDELYARNSKIMEEKIELQDKLAIITEQVEIRSKMLEENLDKEQIIFKYEEQINVLAEKNTELLCNIAEYLKELETLKENKALLYEQDCMNKDKLAEIMKKHEDLIAENNELSTDVMDKIEENDMLKQELNILKNKLELSLKNTKDVSNNNKEQLRAENTILKTTVMELETDINVLRRENSVLSEQLVETIEDLDNVRKINSSNNSLHLSTIFNSTLIMNDTASKPIKDEDAEAKILSLQEELNRLLHLNKKLSDLKLNACSQCTHLKELNENRRILKHEVKSLNYKLEDLQKKFDCKSAKTNSLILKAKENLNISSCNTSFNASFSDHMNVSYVEEKLQSLSTKIQTLQEEHKLSGTYQDNEEEFQNSSIIDSLSTNDVNPSVQKFSLRTSSKLENLSKDLNNLNIELQKIKKHYVSVKADLGKFTNEKESLLSEISSLNVTNKELLQKLSESESLLSTALDKASILENETTNMTKNIQEITVEHKKIENEKLHLEIEVESLREEIVMKEQTINELRKSLSCLQHEVDIIQKQKEELNDSNNFLEQQYEKKLESLKATNRELSNSKEIVSQKFTDYSKESENKLIELNEKINKYTLENDYLKQEMIKLRDIENKFEKMKNEYQSISQQDKTLIEDNKKLKDVLNTASKNIIKEIKSLKPKADTQEFLDKSVDELFQIFLQTILTKEKEIATTMRAHFDKEKQKLEDEKRQSVDAEKRTTLWAKELESEIEKFQGDLSERENMCDGLQKEIAQLKHVLEESKQEKDSLKEKLSVLEMDISNLQTELNKYSKIDTENEEAVIVAQKRERQAHETIKNKEAEFQIKLKSEKESYNKQIEDLACTIELFKTKNMELINNIEGLEANEKQLKNIIDLKTSEIMKNTQSIQKMKTELQHLTEAYNDLSSELENKKLHIVDITELLKNKCDVITEYKAELEIIIPENKLLKQQINERKTNIEQYKNDIDRLKMENEKEIDAIKDELNLEELKNIELNKQIAELNNKNIILTEEKNTLREDYETLQRKSITLEKRVRNSTSKILAEEQMEELKDLNKSLRNNLDGASNRITELQTVKADLMKQLVTLNSQYDVACKENQELKETLSSYKPKFNDSNMICEKYDALLQEKNKLALELEAKKVLLNLKNKDIENYTNQIKELTKTNSELDQESEDLAEVIRQNDAENARLQDKYYSCCVEINVLEEKIKTLEKQNRGPQSRSMQKSNISFDKTDKLHNNKCECTILKNTIQELQLEIVSKNGKIATLELQIRSGSFPYQTKCSELQEHLLACKNKNSELKSEIKRLQLAMLRTSAKECDVCKQRLVNRINQASQTIPNNVLRFCGTSSGIIDDEVKLIKLEKEKKIMKDVCRSRSKMIKDLEKRIEELQMQVLLRSNNS